MTESTRTFQVRQILQMIRFSHTVFALPFALLGAVMAWQMPGSAFRLRDLLAIVLCMVFARSAAMAFNRVVDRRWDAQNPRTAMRHLAIGALSLPQVILFTVVTAAAFVAATLLFLPNWLPLALSGPVLAFLMGYSLTKRFTWTSHYWLGAALMLSPISAWIAIRGMIVVTTPWDLIPPSVLGLAILFWVAGFDIIYACQDEQFDRRAGLQSVPARWGIPTALRLAGICHAMMVLTLFALPWCSTQLDWGWIYPTGVAVVAALLVYEHWLVSPRDLTRVNVAFFHINAVVSLGLLAFSAADLMTTI